MTAPALSVKIQGQGSVPADELNTYEQTCDTIANLRAFIGVTGVQVTTRGRLAIGDGNWGVFYWDSGSTAPDNGTSVIRPVGVDVGAWLLLPFPTGSFVPYYYRLIGSE